MSALAGLIGLGLVLVGEPPAPAAAQTLDEGRQVYEQSCQACHQPGGTGLPATFPPLAGNPNVADPAYVEDVIRNGREGEIVVLGESFNGVMPALPLLTDAQIQAVVSYVESLNSTGEVPVAAAPVAPVTGDPVSGEALFLGDVRLSASGPACVACHLAGTNAGGGSIGPDLTEAFNRLGGQAGLGAWLTSPPTPTMQPLFVDRPLAADEVLHLTAFLATTPGTAVAPGVDWFLVGAVGGLGVLLALMAFVVQGPRGRYVNRLRSET